MGLEISKAADNQRRYKPTREEMGFGNYFSDHIFKMEYEAGKGWVNPRIEPYGQLHLDPAAMVLHYAQSTFEGFKAYPTRDGRVLFFRPELNLRRMTDSFRRICMPDFDEAMVLEAIKELVRLDRAWIPTGRGESLYIRPTAIASEPHIGVRPSNQYIFYVITSPVGAYYKEGFAPVRILVTDKYVRSAVGGLGLVKASANYAASLLAAEEAHQAGWTQVLWLDAASRKFVEEVGTMNIFFYIDDELVTPALSGSILPGITRRSILELAKHWGIQAVERAISIDEVVAKAKTGALKEMFGSGTAAIVSPVSEFAYGGQTYRLPAPQPGPLAVRFFETLLGIQYGEAEDTLGWTSRVI